MTENLTPERADLLEILRARRAFLRVTVQGLTDEQASSTPTVSALCLGGLIKHVTETEAEWARFIVDGPFTGSMEWSEEAVGAYGNQFRLLDGETLEGVLAAYEETAARTDALVMSADLDRRWPLPTAPWFEAGSTRSVRQVFLHIAGETAQHAGHADIIREAIDGQKSMG
ncbi:MAG: DinB family protein [Nakamurella sp.]